ncbi:hypothetical protein HBI37_113330 [Parastagonospora nodorum]|nr:hypothetical protein HBI17_001510 [Parastagonospora nodorum]KAH6339898.1 hypothetical protein HBI37_113330 [Parastagonospora nodorum]
MRLHKSSGGIYEDAEMGIGRLGSVMREWSLGYGKRFREVMEPTGVGSCADLKLQSGVGVWVCDDDTQLWRVHFSEL